MINATSPKQLYVEALRAERAAGEEYLTAQIRLADVESALVAARAAFHAASARHDELSRQVREIEQLIPPAEAAAIRRDAYRPPPGYQYLPYNQLDDFLARLPNECFEDELELHTTH